MPLTTIAPQPVNKTYLTISVELKPNEPIATLDAAIENLIQRDCDDCGLALDGSSLRDLDFSYTVTPLTALNDATKIETWAHAQKRRCLWTIHGGDRLTI